MLRAGLCSALVLQVEMLTAAGIIFDNRKACAMATQMLGDNASSAQSEFQKLSGNASKAAKAQKAELKLKECEARLRAQQEQYSHFVSTMPRELERFEAEQRQETLDAMIQTAEINKMYHERQAMEWDSQLNQLKREVSSTF